MSQRPLTSFRVAVTWAGGQDGGRLQRSTSARVDVVAALRVVEVNGRRVARNAAGHVVEPVDGNDRGAVDALGAAEVSGNGQVCARVLARDIGLDERGIVRLPCLCECRKERASRPLRRRSRVGRCRRWGRRRRQHGRRSGRRAGCARTEGTKSDYGDHDDGHHRQGDEGDNGQAILLVHRLRSLRRPTRQGSARSSSGGRRRLAARCGPARPGGSTRSAP